MNPECKRAILEGAPLIQVSAKDIPIKNGRIIETAVEWMKANPQQDAMTMIGAVRITPSDIKTSFSHTLYPNKLAVLPILRDMLERGVYLGEAADWTRKKAVNHYFAAPVAIDGRRQLLFIRVIQEPGLPKRLHVHEIYTEAEIKKSAGILPSQVTPPQGLQTSDAFTKKTNPADLYRSLWRVVTRFEFTK